MSEHVLEHLSAYLDGALSGDEQDRFRAHLGQCGSCAARLAELAAVDRSLRELPSGAPERYFDELPARLRTRLSASRPARGRLQRLPVWTLAAAAALMVAVLAPLTLLQRPAPAPPEQALQKTVPTAATEVDALSRKQVANAPPAATIPAAPTPAASVAPREEAFERADEKGRTLKPAKREASAGRLEDGDARAKTVAPPAAPPPATATTGGFAGPPRAAEPMAQQSGPRTNQQSVAEKLEQANQAAATPAPTPIVETADRRARDAEKKDAPASEDRAYAKAAGDEKPARVGLAAARPATAGSFRELQARAPKDAAEARTLRESWRRFAAETGDAREADEARVQVIRLGLEAWQLERRPEDRQLAEKDAAAYVARPDARQAERVRGLLKVLGR